MKLGLVSDSLGGLPFQAVLDHAVRIGVSGVGGFLPAFSAEMRTFHEKLASFLLANVGSSGRARRIPAVGPAATPS